MRAAQFGSGVVSTEPECPFASILGGVFQRFTSQARKVMILAPEEARLLGHSFIGTEHILLGLLREGEGLAAQALELSGVSLVPLREKVRETVGAVDTAPSGSPPFTPRAKKVLELSLREALRLGDSHIGTEHLLLGLIQEGNGVATTLLVALGVSPSRVRQQVMWLLSSQRNEMEGEGRERGGSAATSFGEDPSTVSGPRCPRCRVDVSEAVRYRTITATSDVDDDAREPMMIDVLYCGECGTTLEFLRPDRFGMLSDIGPGRYGIEEVAAPENAESLEGQFQIRCRELVTETRALGFNPNVWVSLINHMGALPTAKKLLADHHVLVATPWLVARGRSGLTIEHEIGQTRWRELFTDEDRVEAASRLDDAGKTPS